MKRTTITVTCDCCKKEITAANTVPSTFLLPVISRFIGVVCEWDGSFDFCRYCFIDAVAESDDRMRPDDLAKGWNHSGVTNEQLAVDEGWRLRVEDETVSKEDESWHATDQYWRPVRSDIVGKIIKDDYTREDCIRKFTIRTKDPLPA